MRLILIRHGQTPSNVAGELDTAAPGAGLTPLGKAQAAAVPGALADETIAAIYASPRLRTKLTAQPLADDLGLPLVVRHGLEEISAGVLEMRADEEAVLTYIDTLADWLRGDLGRSIPGGYDGHRFLARFGTAIESIAADHADETVAVFSHGAAIRAWSFITAGVDPEEAVDRRIRNTGAAYLEGDPAKGWELVQWHPDPLGGVELSDALAHDVTGESTEEVEEDLEES